ncbi:MAG: hypothetical protein ACRD1H_14380 [Vicinamibacterales bacterium]
MKDINVSQSIAPPANVPIVYDPTADDLIVDWLAERVRQAIQIVIDAAPRCGVTLKNIWVEGWESYEEPTRELVVIPEVGASDDAVSEFWGILAEAISALNQPPPPGAKNDDVTIQVSVRW